MKKNFTIKPVLIALLAMISCTMKAKTIECKIDGGFVYSLDTKTQEASLDRYRGDAMEVVIPNFVTYEGVEYKVTSLGSGGCFEGCRSLTSVVIPSSVTSVGDYSFSNCFSLRSVVIPSSVTSLGSNCFNGCSSLMSVVISSSVTSLGSGCFNGCRSLMSVVIPSSVTSLGSGCFEGCRSLMSVELPSSVTHLESNCFSGCSSLQTVICKMKKVIREGSLFGNSSIESATLYVSESLLGTYKSTAPWKDFGTILPWTE